MKLLKRIAAALRPDEPEAKKEPLILHLRNGIYMKNVPPKGRGVFCREDIKAGEIIEVAPVLIFTESDMRPLSRTLLNDDIFSARGRLLSPDLADLLNIKDPAAVASLPMGIASFRNHLVHPNAALEQAADEHTPVDVLIAKEDTASPGPRFI